MKKTIFSSIVCALICGAFSSLHAQTWAIDSVTMGAGYANEIFYQMNTGQAGTAPMTNWEIAHTTNKQDNCIKANHIAGVMVMNYKKGDTSAWNTFDTAGWSNWTKYYNDNTDRKLGAFNRTPDKSDQWDFSWGKYDFSNHVVVGDSLYLLKTKTGFFKFWPVKQPSSGNLVIRFAKLDNSWDTTVTLITAGTAANYTYYNLTNRNSMLREPGKTNWDISFTRYYAPTYNPGTGKMDMYAVMGVESNAGTAVVKVAGVKVDDAGLHDFIGGMKDNLSGIGSDWKTFNQGTLSYTMKDSQSYFIKDVAGNYWQMRFTAFDYTIGKVVFAKRLIQGASVEDHEVRFARIYPNPASDGQISIITDAAIRGEATLRIFDMSGKVVASETFSRNEGLSAVQMKISAAAGIYTAEIRSGNLVQREKLVIR